MRIIDLETINQAMNNETQFVLRCEEVFHDLSLIHISEPTRRS